MNTLLHQRQQEMMSYLRGESDTISQHIVDQGKISRLERLAIYHNAYQKRLIECMEVDHPITAGYLGYDAFFTMCISFINLHPSNSCSLRNFADSLPLFLNTTGPYNQLPEVSELACFERLLLDCFDAHDGKRATVEDLIAQPQAVWPDLKLYFHPSVFLFCPKWNCVNIWQALKVNQQPPKPARSSESWIIWRNEERLSEFISLNSVDKVLLTELYFGNSFAAACEQLADLLPEEKVSQTLVDSLVKWLGAGIVAEFYTGTPSVTMKSHFGRYPRPCHLLP